MERWSRRHVALMGILNVTPDSFSDGGEYLDPDRAVAHGLELVADGAQILDIGGESTRPGAQPVPEAEELRRVIPVVERIVAARRERREQGRFRISVDTSKLAVAEQALAAGAEIVNDVTAMRKSPEMAALCAERGAAVVLMHMQGTPLDMQDAPSYDDVVAEVTEFLSDRARVAIEAGVAADRIWLDPGIGFGKTRRHNLQLLAGLDRVAQLGFPVLVGTSRKSFIEPAPTGSATSHEPDAASLPQRRIGGTVASGLLAVQHGAGALRVHDVAAMRTALEVAAAIDRVA